MNSIIRLMAAALVVALVVPTSARADSLLLTLDLTNNDVADPASGGQWQLFARKIETGTGAQGDYGVSGIRAILHNINIDSIAFADDINQLPGGPFINQLANGAVEAVYGQDLSSATVVIGVGVNPISTQDSLIAVGNWPAGPRPTFGLDPGGDGSAGNFLGAGGPPFPGSIQPDAVDTMVVTLGDLNNSETVTFMDVALFQAQLPPAIGPYNPAADLDQSGTITPADYALFLDMANIPEPSALVLTCTALMGLGLRRR